MRAVKIIGIVVVVIVVAVAIAGYSLFGGLQAATAGPQLGAGVSDPGAGRLRQRVLCWTPGTARFVLIDAGSDNKGTALLQDLQMRHGGADNVVAVLLTHSHQDHIAALPLFSKAMVYATKREVPLAASQGRLQWACVQAHGRAECDAV